MLLVIQTINTPTHFKGLLRRFMVEPHTGLFIGRVTRKVAESIWEMLQADITSEDFSCLWILGNSKEEQGYEIREMGKELLQDFDGFVLPIKLSRKKP